MDRSSFPSLLDGNSGRGFNQGMGWTGRGRQWGTRTAIVCLLGLGAAQAWAQSVIPIKLESLVGNELTHRALAVPADILKKSSEIREKNRDGRVVAFQGPSLAAWVDEALKGLTAAERAQVDLVVIQGKESRSTRFLPRAFLVKYPQIQLAYLEGGKAVSDAPRVILPLLTKSKIRSEGVLLEPLQVSGVQEIILTSYQNRAGSARLERRTDPSAMRGEKLYLQDCLSCHGTGAARSLPIKAGEAGLDAFVSFLEKRSHPEVEGLKSLTLQFNDKQLKSIDAYLRAKAAEQKP